MSLVKKAASKGLFLKVVILLVVVIVCDLFVGTVFIRKDYRQALEIRNLHPYYNHGFNPSEEGIVNFGPLEYTIYTNSLAMLDAGPKQVPLAIQGKKRIMFIGDSFTEGQGFPYKETYCGYLSSMLDSNKYDVLNAGVASFSPKLYYLRLKYLFEVEKLKVNEVFCFVDYSDITDELLYEDFKPELPGTLQKIYNAVEVFLKGHSIVYFAQQNIRKNKFLKAHNLGAENAYMFFVATNDEFLNTCTDFNELKKDWAADKLYNTPCVQKGVTLALDNMKKVKQLCDDNNVVLHVGFYPPSQHLVTPNAMVAFKNTINLWTGFCAQNKIDCINLYPYFICNDAMVNAQRKVKYYIDGDSHWNARGHKHVADTLYNKIMAGQ